MSGMPFGGQPFGAPFGANPLLAGQFGGLGASSFGLPGSSLSVLNRMADPFGLGVSQFPGSSFGMGPVGSSFGQNSFLANPFSSNPFTSPMGAFSNSFGPSNLIGNPLGPIGGNMFNSMGPNFPGSPLMPGIQNQFNANPMLGNFSAFGSPNLPGFAGGNQFNMTGQLPLRLLPTTYTAAPVNLQTAAP